MQLNPKAATRRLHSPATGTAIKIFLTAEYAKYAKVGQGLPYSQPALSRSIISHAFDM